MFKNFLNLPMGRLVTVETLPHYQLNLSFQSASQGNMNMILNQEDATKLKNMLNDGIVAMDAVNEVESDEEVEA